MGYLTPWDPVYKIPILRNHALRCCFHATFQLHNSPVNYARDLFKPSRDSPGLLVGSEEIFGFGLFVRDVKSGIGLSLFGLNLSHF